jgi:ABC-type transport system involved in multi-copper enzyme maturation permease subunit
MAAITPYPGARSGAAPATGRWADLTGTIGSEFTKMRSVRSTYWSLILVVVASLAWTIADCAGTAAHWASTSPQARAGLDPTQDSLLGLGLFGLLIISVLGALAITSEYSTGMIRTSLTVMPRRGVVYAAKAIVLAVVTLTLAVLTSFICFFAGQRLLASTHMGASLSGPHVLRAVLVTALLVTLGSLFAFGIGALLRHTAGVITAVFGIFFLLPRLAQALPASWYNDIQRWLPGANMIGVITGTTPGQQQPHMFYPWGEFAVFAGYTVIVLALGAVALLRRDA